MKADVQAKKYYDDNERYADVINGIVFNGRQIVKPDDLHELDTQTGIWSIQAQLRKQYQSGKVKIRDLIRKTAFGINFAIIGIENQETVDYALPLRVASYDIGEYERQAAKIRKQIRKNRTGTKLSSGEFLYGFARASKLYPVITIVLYYGDNWDGAKELKEIVDFTGIPPEIQSMVGNYGINLVEVRKLKDTSVFQTDIRLVFDYLRYSKDKNALKDLVDREPAYQDMDEEAFDMALLYTGEERLIQKRDTYIQGGKANMCKAIDDLIEDGRLQGMEQGIERGEERLNRLIAKLIEENNIEDLKKVTASKEYREKLYQKYHL